MKRNIRSLTSILSILALIWLSSGCATSQNHKLKCKPVTGYPKAELLDLNVVLELKGAFAGGVVFERKPFPMSPGVRYTAPGSLEASAEAMARALFQEVLVVRGPVRAAAHTSDAVICPRVVTVEEAYDLKGGATLLLEWTVSLPNGDLVWKETIRGDGTGSMGMKTLFQRAMEDAFQRTFEEMSQSPEIRALALKRSGVTGNARQQAMALFPNGLDMSRERSTEEATS